MQKFTAHLFRICSFSYRYALCVRCNVRRRTVVVVERDIIIFVFFYVQITNQMQFAINNLQNRARTTNDKQSTGYVYKKMHVVNSMSVIRKENKVRNKLRTG